MRGEDCVHLLSGLFHLCAAGRYARDPTEHLGLTREVGCSAGWECCSGMLKLLQQWRAEEGCPNPWVFELLGQPPGHAQRLSQDLAQFTAGSSRRQSAAKPNQRSQLVVWAAERPPVCGGLPQLFYRAGRI